MRPVGTNGPSEACSHPSLIASSQYERVPGFSRLFLEGGVRMSQLTFTLTGPSSVDTFKSVHHLLNTKHVAGPGLIKTNITVS